MIVFFNESYKSHNRTVLSQPLEITNRPLLEILTEVTKAECFPIITLL